MLLTVMRGILDRDICAPTITLCRRLSPVSLHSEYLTCRVALGRLGHQIVDVLRRVRTRKVPHFYADGVGVRITRGSSRGSKVPLCTCCRVGNIHVPAEDRRAWGKTEVRNDVPSGKIGGLPSSVCELRHGIEHRVSYKRAIEEFRECAFWVGVSTGQSLTSD